ncbi:MAG: tRNA1(Val) (adenine(37)-N6)-methyltransferase [Bacteroidetes bacterium]|nr:tRNA1(Val) (adenine(37)-N6)-methyltransferase [Bacteroidota bacterium]MDF1865520.1 tRNA1(Val) (adenine(37)-N6)-methyltransferase [Saprospiraceae bacterium]
MKKSTPFQFKQFSVSQDRCPMKVGTDGVLLGAWADGDDTNKILDIGTGTGLIALMMAQRSKKAKIHAVEIDQNAFEQAKENAQNVPWSERIEIFHDSIQDFAKTSFDTYDLIVSNPPFFSGGTFSGNQDRLSVRHTIKLPHGDLLAVARKLLAKDGKFCLILPFMEGLRFQEMAKQYNLFCTKTLAVKPLENKPVERLLLQFEKTEKDLIQENLIIQTEGRNNWTEAYIELTGDFYLKM